MPDNVLDGLSVERRRAYWTDVLSDIRGGGAVWVAESSGRVVGFVNVQHHEADDSSPARGEIAALYVLPEHWSTGLGRALLEAAVTTLRAAGLGTATLCVLRDNGRARRFYERAGWRVEGDVESHEIGGHAIPEVHYRLDLASTDGPP